MAVRQKAVEFAQYLHSLDQYDRLLCLGFLKDHLEDDSWLKAGSVPVDPDLTLPGQADPRRDCAQRLQTAS